MTWKQVTSVTKIHRCVKWKQGRILNADWIEQPVWRSLLSLELNQVSMRVSQSVQFDIAMVVLHEGRDLLFAFGTSCLQKLQVHSALRCQAQGSGHHGKHASTKQF